MTTVRERVWSAELNHREGLVFFDELRHIHLKENEGLITVYGPTGSVNLTAGQ